MNQALNEVVNKYRRGQVGIGEVLGVFITVLIGVIFAGPFLAQVTNTGVNVTGASLENYTGGAGAIGNQLPLFWILLIVAVLVVPMARAFGKID